MAMVVLAAGLTQVAHAATFYAPSVTNGNASGTRFDLENTGTTTATSLTVSVYFQNRPTSGVTVMANSFKKGGTWDKGACFVGYTCLYGPHTAGPLLGNDSGSVSFTLPASGWTYDSLYGMWRQNITANYSSANSAAAWDNWVHFRLSLGSGSAGIIANGGGGTANFADWNSTPTTGSPPRTYVFRMATPCGVTSNQTRSIILGDLDSGSDNDNSGYNVTVTLVDETTG